VTALAASAARAEPRVRVLDVLFFSVLFTTTFEKVHWSIGGAVGISDVLTFLFLVVFLVKERQRPLPQTSAIVLGFFVLFVLVYLFSSFDVTSAQGTHQFAKGMVKVVLHFLFLIAAVAYLARGGEELFRRSLVWFTAGFAANAAYGILELLAARAGFNLDNLVLNPLTRGAAKINIYGAVNGQHIYRPNALTGDPNHLGVMLIVPVLMLTPVYLRLERGHPRKWRLAALLAFLLLTLLATLSRSGLLGLGVGILVLLLPYRRYVLTRELLAPLAVLAALLAAVVASQWHFFSVVIKSRVQTGGSDTSAHFAVYNFIPQILHSQPVFGLGLNTFSLYYEAATGKTNWGPHSFWVAVTVESGVAGLVAWLVFLRYVYLRLRAGRHLGRLLDRAGDALGARIRPLAWGMTAALTGTIAANFFYLTMQFYYFYVFLAFALALPIVFARRGREALG